MIKKHPFGTTRYGQAVDLYTAANKHGLQVRAMTHGGIIISLRVPDQKAQLEDAVLGYDIQ
jgi:aldose 1-epimerase